MMTFSVQTSLGFLGRQSKESPVITAGPPARAFRYDDVETAKRLAATFNGVVVTSPVWNKATKKYDFAVWAGV